jgi:hypothetical protein
MNHDLEELHVRIQAALDLCGPEQWTARQARRVLDVLIDVAAESARDEIDEVGR